MRSVKSAKQTLHQHKASLAGRCMFEEIRWELVGECVGGPWNRMQEIESWSEYVAIESGDLSFCLRTYTTLK